MTPVRSLTALAASALLGVIAVAAFVVGYLMATGTDPVAGGRNQ